MLLGCIADDFTGASDLANTLTRGGMRTIQFNGIPAPGAAAACEAGVVALKSRSIPAAEAVAQSLAALAWLRQQGCTQVLFKYCSTFDSTPEGNIGPVAEALLAALDAPFTIVCPAFPAIGRSLYQGHLFVGDRLLSESGMEHHPLTPMTDPDIRRWLQRQTRLPVGHVPYAQVQRGTAAIEKACADRAAAGDRLLVVDAVADADLFAIGAAARDLKLVTGASGIALGLPENFRARGLLAEAGSAFTPLDGPGVVLSGSCSRTSLAQVAAYKAKHPAMPVAPADILSGALTVDAALQFVAEHPHEAPLIYSTAAAGEVVTSQEAFGREAVAEAVEAFFATLAEKLVAGGVRRLVVGGGETSGAVVAALRAGQLLIGPEIDPGVPALAVDGDVPIRLALKSGNFGAVDFFEKALAVLAGGAAPQGPVGKAGK